MKEVIYMVLGGYYILTVFLISVHTSKSVKKDKINITGGKGFCALLSIQVILYLLLNRKIGSYFDVINNIDYCIYVLLFLASTGTWHITSIFTLGGNWSDSHKMRDGAKLITKGVYSVVRHPIYTAFIMHGVGLILISPILIPFGAWCSLIPFIRLIKLKEEDLLIEEFKEEYIEYMNITKYKLIPYIW